MAGNPTIKGQTLKVVLDMGTKAGWFSPIQALVNKRRKDRLGRFYSPSNDSLPLPFHVTSRRTDTYLPYTYPTFQKSGTIPGIMSNQRNTLLKFLTVVVLLATVTSGQ